MSIRVQLRLRGCVQDLASAQSTPGLVFLPTGSEASGGGRRLLASVRSLLQARPASTLP